jgi:hypothetical protein
MPFPGLFWTGVDLEYVKTLNNSGDRILGMGSLSKAISQITPPSHDTDAAAVPDSASHKHSSI